MPFMLLYIGDGRAFDAEAVYQALDKSGAVRRDAADRSDLIVYDYELGNDFTTIRIKDDLETIVVDGSDAASFDVALKLQREYDEPIHVVDEAYSFDLILDEYDSTAALLKAAIKTSFG